MYVDLPSDAEVRSLLETVGPTCVSIYMPATPQPDDADAERIGFKNLMSSAIEQLQAGGTDKREVAAIAEILAEIGEDPSFWRYQANSLAVFATVDGLHVYRLANRLEAHSVVADRFALKPLLRAVTFPSAGFVLALAQGSVRLLEFGGDYGPHDVEVADLPAGIDEFSRTVPGAAGASEFGVQSPEGQRSLQRKFARQVDRSVRAALRGHELPVVLYAAEPLAGIFRSVSTLPMLAPTGVVGSPERVPPHELVAAARTVLDGVHAAELAKLVERFEQRAGQGRSATDLADVARSATYGAIDVLILDIDNAVAGTIGDDGELVLGDGPGTYVVVDEIARRVVATRGRVVAVRADEVPGGSGVAATLRYA